MQAVFIAGEGFVDAYTLDALGDENRRKYGSIRLWAAVSWGSGCSKYALYICMYCTFIYIYIYIPTFIFIYIYIHLYLYIYRERESVCVCVTVHLYIERERECVCV